VGTNQQYAEGWESAFTGKRRGASAGKSTKKKPAPSKKASPKKSGKKARK
jgi:hypothetical protein